MGALFAGSECVVEKVSCNTVPSHPAQGVMLISWLLPENFDVCALQIRAKHDIYNVVYAGCAAGGVLASSAGPKAMCAGCVTFAAFSAFIDKMMDHN